MRCLRSAWSTETLSGGLPSPQITPGTRPARRSARAAPLPARDRAAAFICLTVVAMVQILLNKAAADIGAAHPHPQHASKRVRNKRVQKRVWAAGVLAQARAVPAVRRAYSEHDGERQETRAGTAREEKRWRRKWLWVAAGAELGFERGDARLQGLVLLAREPRHLLDRLEFLALDHVEVAQDAVGLVAEHGIEFAPHARGDAGRVVHQPRHLVEETVAGLGHRWSRVRIQSACRNNGDGLLRPQGRPGRVGYIRPLRLDLATINAVSAVSCRPRAIGRTRNQKSERLGTPALGRLTSRPCCPHHPGT